MARRNGKQSLSFIIRTVKRSDAEDLIDNYLRLYSEVKRDPLVGISLMPKKPTRAEERKWFTALMKKQKNGSAVASVAEVDGKAVGLCEVGPKGMSAEQKHVGTLGILVREGYRSGGVGTALMGETLRKARKKYAIVCLDVFGTNKAAQRLYRRFGFKQYGLLPGGLEREGKKIDEIKMYRRL